MQGQPYLRTGQCTHTNWTIPLPTAGAAGLLTVAVLSDDSIYRTVGDSIAVYLNGDLQFTELNTACEPIACEHNITIGPSDTSLVVRAISAHSVDYNHMLLSSIKLTCASRGEALWAVPLSTPGTASIEGVTFSSGSGTIVAGGAFSGRNATVGKWMVQNHAAPALADDAWARNALDDAVLLGLSTAGSVRWVTPIGSVGDSGPVSWEHRASQYCSVDWATAWASRSVQPIEECQALCAANPGCAGVTVGSSGGADDNCVLCSSSELAGAGWATTHLKVLYVPSDVKASITSVGTAGGIVVAVGSFMAQLQSGNASTPSVLPVNRPVGAEDTFLTALNPVNGAVQWIKAVGLSVSNPNLANTPVALASGAEQGQFFHFVGYAGPGASLGGNADGDPLYIAPSVPNPTPVAWLGAFSTILDWRPHKSPVHEHHLGCPEQLGRTAAYGAPIAPSATFSADAAAACNASLYETLQGPFAAMCMADAFSSQQLAWTLPAVAASVEAAYEKRAYSTSLEASGLYLVDAVVSNGSCTAHSAGLTESRASFEPPLPKSPVAISLLFTLCVNLYSGELVTLSLPGFRAAPTATAPCAVGDITCLQQPSLRLSGPDASKFVAHWQALSDMEDGVLSLMLASPKILRHTPVELTVEQHVWSPDTGLTPGSQAVTFAVEFNSVWRSGSASFEQGQVADIGATALYGLTAIAKFNTVELSFDPPHANTVTEVSLVFSLSVELNPGEAVHLILPGFTGETFKAIPMEGDSTPGFTASWTSPYHTAYPELGAGLPSSSLIVQRVNSSASMPAGTSVMVVLPASAGVKLPLNGLCDLWDMHAILVVATTKPPVEAINVVSFGQIATTELCPRPSPQLEAPHSVALGEDIVVYWKAGTALRPRVSQRFDWVALYKAGECDQASPLEGASLPGDMRVNQAQAQLLAQWQHTCFLAMEELGPHQEGGEVRFALGQYKMAGEYQVRYFAGESSGGSGMVCRSLRSLMGTRAVGNYVHCMLESVASSTVVHVQESTEKVARMGQGALPGLHPWAEEPYLRSYEGGDIRSPL